MTGFRRYPITLVMIIISLLVKAAAAHQQPRYFGSRRSFFATMESLCLAAVSPTSSPGGRKVVKAPTALLLEAQLSDCSSKSSHQEPNFPPHFLFGAATSSYQIEGGAYEGGRGPTVWDTFAHAQPSPILDQSSGDIACDHYHRVKEDVQLMKDINLKAYRFSIAWSRILPSGTRDSINQAGIDFYNHLIDTLIENDIIPMVTLFHWDTPQALEDQFGGWLDRRTAEIFATDYARIAFAHFGDRVKHWITLNEPWTVSVIGYCNGEHAPGRCQDPINDPYLAAHHFLLAHAQATQIYRTEFAPQQKGLIGIANNCDFRYPLVPDDPSCQEAAERAMLFHFGWFVDPLYFGDYPAAMRERLGDRLPTFTEAERELLLEANTDFLGLNYYQSFLVSAPETEKESGGYWDDMHVVCHANPEWRLTDMGWNVAPDGLRELLLWISKRYNNPKIYITENGSAEPEPNVDAAIKDENRRKFYEDHLRACSRAIHAGVDLAGYFAWSLMDNYEWGYGYLRRFGMIYVDFETLERVPKSSALFYAKTILAHGENIEIAEQDQKVDALLLLDENENSRTSEVAAIVG